jgi:hypothetical protein
MAYVLLCALRRIGLHHTEYAKATCGTIRLKLLKVGALVRISVRRIKVAMASACPAAEAWGLAVVRRCRPKCGWNYNRHNLRETNYSRLCGEFNWLIDGLCGEGLPAIDVNAGAKLHRLAGAKMHHRV